MRPLEKLIVHCSATPPDMDIGVKEITVWHLRRGWSDIGYHWVIRRSGKVEAGRPVEKIGAHTLGQNTGSIGVCLVGGVNDKGDPDANFTLHQYESLDQLKDMYAGLEVKGHRDFSSKSCPCFDCERL